MNVKLLEASLFLILLVNFLRDNLVVNPIVLLILALLYMGFLILSLDFVNIKSAGKYRFFLFWLIVAIAFSFVIFRIDPRLGMHDGAVLTKTATGAFITGQNPYRVSYQNAFDNIDAKPLGVVYDHYMYSPLMFITNIPADFIFSGWHKGNEFLITIMVFFIFSAVAASFLVSEKLLFLILFLLNPIFVPLAFYGANEAIILFFLTLTILMLNRGSIALATVSLALAAGAKLLVLPFVPLYFIYILIKTRNQKPEKSRWFSPSRNKQLVAQLLIFGLVTLVIYLPFFVWGPSDFMEDVIYYHLRGGVESHVIAGFLGIPSILSGMKVITVDSGFPFYIFQLLVGIGVLPFIYKILRKFPSLRTLTVVFVIYFSLIFIFSRIMQSSYIAFLSQMILLTAFLEKPVSRSG